MPRKPNPLRPYTTVRIRRETAEKLRRMARENDTTMGSMVEILIRERRLEEQLAKIETALRRQEMLLKRLLQAVEELRAVGGVARREIEVPELEGLEVPDFVRENPWLAVIRERA